jgi:hypothetical protein
MEVLIKIGPWGGRDSDPRDDIVAAGVAPHRLESVVITPPTFHNSSLGSTSCGSD